MHSLSKKGRVREGECALHRDLYHLSACGDERDCCYNWTEGSHGSAWVCVLVLEQQTDKPPRQWVNNYIYIYTTTNWGTLCKGTGGHSELQAIFRSAQKVYTACIRVFLSAQTRQTQLLELGLVRTEVDK